MSKKSLLLFYLCMFLACTEWIQAQNTDVSGIVVYAEDGEPVIGANVQVKGTQQGTITDIDGKFLLKGISLSAKLHITYVGLKPQEVKAKPNLRIAMESDAQMLEGVVVTGMSKVDKRLFTGAADKVDASKARIDGMPDISRSLEGRSAGVSVQNVSGTFGTAPKIRVRGATSIYGNSKPLWVVDGVIMEDAVDVSTDDLSSGDAVTLISSAISGLSADDIESFQILKDGSATSIYGARAMAGVVVITTKRGQVGLSSINYTGELTYRMVPHYSEFNIMNSQEQMDVYKEMEDKGWLLFSETARAANSGVYGKMYQMINTYNPNTDSYLLDNTLEARYAYLEKAEMRNTDWFNILFNQNIVQTHSVSISTGSEKARMYASLSLYNDPGWTKASSVNRYTANMNASFNLSDKLSALILGSGSYRKQVAPGTLSQQLDVVNGQVKRDFDINPYSYALNTSRTLQCTDENGKEVYYTRNYADFNILHELDNNYIDLNVADLKFQRELKWRPVKGLELSGLAAIKYSTTGQEHNIKDHSNQAESYRAMGDATIRDSNPLLYTDPDLINSLPITILPEGGIYTRTDYSMRGIDIRATATYNTSINNTHILNFFGGFENSSIDRTRSWFRGWGYQYDKGGTPFYDYNVFKQGKEENTNYYTNEAANTRSVAFFVMGTYSYEGKYTLTGTGRYEGTNRLGKSRSARWLPTWNIAGAWNVHEEKFYSNFSHPVLSHATLKASYSLTADRGPAFVTNSQTILNSYSPWRPSASVTESGMRITELENSELTYEKKHEFNVGVDLGFLHNRINLAADYYRRNNFDLIGVINTQGAGGTIAKYANIASMRSSGIELTLSTQNIKKKGFSWNTDFIFSKTKNEITDLKSHANVLDLISGNGFGREGYPVRALFSIPFAGLTEDGLPTFINQDGQRTISTLNFQEYEKLGFLKYEGPTDPTITGSFGNILTYENFKLNVFLTYSFGNVIRLDPVFSSAYSDLDAMPKEFKNRWMKAGDENTTNIPTIVSYRMNQQYAYLNMAYNAYNYSDVRIADGGFIRLKEISLSYDLPAKVLNFFRLNKLQFKIQATNLFLLYADSKLNGQDPEFFRSGGVSTPVPRQFTFTIRLGL